MNKEDLNDVAQTLAEATGLFSVLQERLEDLIEISMTDKPEKDSQVAYEVIRSREAYQALDSSILDKLIDSRRLLEAGMKQGGDDDGQRA